MKLTTRQRVWLAVVLLVNGALWLVPSDIVEQIARDRHTMLGRYSRGHFNWIIGVTIISLVSLYLDWSKGKTHRRRWFQVLAVVMFLFPALGAADFLLRTPERLYYVRDSLAYHRPPNSKTYERFEDKPNAHRTYPNAPKGYGTVECTLTTDAMGYRNPNTRERVDIVVLGDSFAEGSKVSDEHAWPARLETISDMKVCNLGMSGYNPVHYLAALRENGLDLRPRYVLCMLYEGNDFRSTESDYTRTSLHLSQRVKTYFKQSPILDALDGLLINTFGPVNSRGTVAGVEILDWLPLTIPASPDAQHYAFAPKQLRDLWQSKEQFAGDKRWRHVREQLGTIKRVCIEAGCRLAIVYAPTKAHVILPLVERELPAAKVRNFTALSYRKELPEAKTFLGNLLQRLGAKESVIADWCRSESVPLLTLTEALRDAAGEGTQVYFTYDQHWTPHGHEVVADAVLGFIAAETVDDPTR